MKLLKILVTLIVTIPGVLFAATYVQFPSITWDERVMYLQVEYWYPALEWLGL